MKKSSGKGKGRNKEVGVNMNNLTCPSVLSMEGDLSQNWKKWKISFQIYLIASGAEKIEEKRKLNLFLHLLGEEAREKLFELDLSEEERNSLDKLVEKLDKYCEPAGNETISVQIFNNRVQTEGESFQDFYRDLRKLSKGCNFGAACDNMLKHKIISGLYDRKLKEKLLFEKNVDLFKVIDVCTGHEVMISQLSKLENNEKEVYAMKKNGQKACTCEGRRETREWNRSGERREVRSWTRPPGDFKCRRCGMEHERYKCPAFRVRCFNCKEVGHFQIMCRRNRNVNVNEMFADDSDSYNNNDYVYLSSINSVVNVDSMDWCKRLKILTTKPTEINFKLDTGAQVNVLPWYTFKNLNLNVDVITKTQTTLRTYDGGQLDVLGKCFLNCMPDDGNIYKIDFHVVKTKSYSPPILGLPAIKKMILLRMVDVVEKQNNLDPGIKMLISRYNHLFSGLGEIKNFEYKICVDKSVSGYIEPCRKIPFKLQDKVKAELDSMEQQNVITKVTCPTEWVNAFVLVKKPDNSVRICLDPRKLNKALKREHYKIPAFEEIISKFNGAKVFSVLDAAKGFFQIKLSTESSYLTTFNTPYGRYRYLRMPFGICTAPEVFQRVFYNVFQGLEGIGLYIDDLIVWGKDFEEHNDRLKKVLERAEQFNVKFNQNKCKFGLNEVNYVGHILTGDGIKPDRKKISAILDMSSPKNTKELERFLGMATYVSKFIPNFSQISNPLRLLLKKNVHFSWLDQHEQIFEKLKHLITTAPVLGYYDVRKPVTLSVDASQDGLGAVLLQSDKPIAYASKALTNAQKAYAQIEKELLAILFGCTKFHQYCYGKTIKVETDHKPLISIFNKPLNDCPLRLQKMLLRLQIYDLEVIYKRGKDLFIADTLSRCYQQDKECTLDENNIEANVSMITDNVNIGVNDNNYNKFRTETNKDEELTKLKNIIMTGWPTDRSRLNKCLHPYWTFKDELTVYDDVVLKNNKIIVPSRLRQEMLEKLHYPHLGIDKCKSRAREILFWVGMNKDIEKYIKNCDVCLSYKNQNVKEPMLCHDIPNLAWQDVAADVFHLKGKNYLLIVDCYSKFPEIKLLEHLDTFTIIKKLKSVFSVHGIPVKLYTDNGNFPSAEFRKFCKGWGINHVTSSPKYPQSNGFIERHIQTIKKCLKKCLDDNKDIDLTLLEYRNTPISYELPSPAQLLFNRRLRGLLPMNDRLLKPEIQDVRETLTKIQKLNKNYYDKNARPLTKLKPNDNVRICNYRENSKIWHPGRIIDENIRPRSYRVILRDGTIVDRNRRHIIPGSNNNNFYTSPVQSMDNNVGSENCVKNNLQKTRYGRVIKPPDKF